MWKSVSMIFGKVQSEEVEQLACFGSGDFVVSWEFQVISEGYSKVFDTVIYAGMVANPSGVLKPYVYVDSLQKVMCTHFEWLSGISQRSNQLVDRIDVHLQLIGFCIPDFQVVCVVKRLAGYVFWEIVYVDHEEELGLGRSPAEYTGAYHWCVGSCESHSNLKSPRV